MNFPLQVGSSKAVAVQVPISRGDFEAAVQPLLRRVWAVMQRAGDAVFLEWADRWWVQPRFAAQHAQGGAPADSWPHVAHVCSRTQAGRSAGSLSTWRGFATQAV